jgi:hypothetical protein
MSVSYRVILRGGGDLTTLSDAKLSRYRRYIGVEQ